MTAPFTHRITTTEQIGTVPTDIQRRILLSFCVTVFIGMTLCLMLIARRASSLPSGTPNMTASDGESGKGDANLGTSQALGGVEINRSNQVWVVMSVPDPPLLVTPSTSPNAVEVAGENRDWKRPSLKLDIFAIQDAWVEVEADGHAIYAKLVRAEQTLSFEALERIRILTGNAPGVELRFNGKQVAPSSANRRVRTLEFTTQGSRELHSRQQRGKS